ncbi:MAG: serine hydrolase [Eubacteriales bacterium]|nr:serine hydrolase [Eubacteriales bacterium]
MFSLDQYIKYVEENDIKMDSIMVVQNDQLLGKHFFHEEIDRNVYSIAKSFTCTAIGMLVEEGLLKVTDKPVDFFPEVVEELERRKNAYAEKTATGLVGDCDGKVAGKDPDGLDDGMDPRWKDVTLENLMTMTSGHGAPYFMAVDRVYLRGEKEAKPDQTILDEWLFYAFTRPMVYEPGEKFVYGNLAPYVAGRMVEKVTGMTLLDFLYERLWKPLGVKKPKWETDNVGHTFPASSLYLGIEDMVKFGLVFLGKGEYHGHRYVTESWVERATSNILPSDVINPTGDAPEEKQGYGYYFWQNSGEGYRAYGKEGQLIIILPSKNAVIVTQGRNRDCQQVFDVVKEFIYPQL